MPHDRMTAMPQDLPTYDLQTSDLIKLPLFCIEELIQLVKG